VADRGREYLTVDNSALIADFDLGGLTQSR